MRLAKQKARRWAGLVGPAALLLLAAGCANDRGPHPELPRMGLYAAFTSHNLCGLGVSPEIRFIKPPPNATTYRIKMTNVSALSGPSSEFTLPASMAFDRSGQMVIPEGAIADFPAPCVPEGIIQQYFNYRMEVLALENGRPLAYGWNFSVAYSLSRQLGYEQLAEQQRRRERIAARGASPQPAPAPAASPSSQDAANTAANTPTGAGTPSPSQAQPDDISPQPSAPPPPLLTGPLPTTITQNSPSSAVPQPQLGPRIVRPFAPYPPEITSYYFIY
jgi:hypothetical protein